MRNRVPLLSVLGLVILTAGATHGQGQAGPTHVIGILTTNHASYKRGEPVEMRFVVKNPTKSSQHYDFVTARQFDVWVSDARGVEVWRWSRDRAYAPVMTAFSLAPGESKTYTAEYDLNRTLPLGIYTAMAALTPSVHPAIRGGMTFNPDNDPNNVGGPKRSGTETGTIVESGVGTQVAATAKFVIDAN